MEEKLSTTVCFQAALLYTSSKGALLILLVIQKNHCILGDRRIRVHTMCLPTTADLAEVYSGFDLKATVSLISKIGELYHPGYYIVCQGKVKECFSC